MSMYQRVLVPVDGSPTSRKGLAEAIRLARLTGGRLRLLHVVNELLFATGYELYTGDVMSVLKEGGEKILSDAKEVVMAAGIGVETVCRETFGGRLCDIVVEEATQWNADLIVIGTHGRRGVGRLLIGSDAEQIVRVAPVPVLLVRGSQGGAATSALGHAGKVAVAVGTAAAPA
jgi:nucleotide-binding universal stress UspA family protein